MHPYPQNTKRVQTAFVASILGIIRRQPGMFLVRSEDGNSVTSRVLPDRVDTAQAYFKWAELFYRYEKKYWEDYTTFENIPGYTTSFAKPTQDCIKDLRPRGPFNPDALAFSGSLQVGDLTIPAQQ